METHKINPDKITKPIQLLAAWLVGLILVNCSFFDCCKSFNSSILDSSLVSNCCRIECANISCELVFIADKISP